MFRILFTIALIFIQVLILDQSSYARGDQFLRYSTLSMAEKKKIVSETMKLVVSLEAKYKFESSKKKPNDSKLKKYTYLLQKAQSFLLDSAHASSSYTQRFQNFASLLNNPDKCIYGGWISQIKDGYCTHPMRLERSSTERQAYSGQGCRAPQEIGCNPLIFGHKVKDQNSVFCVPAGASENRAHNSSLRCMQKALSAEGDGKEKRLEDLASEIQANPSQAQALFEFVSKACICEAELPGLNENYHKYMRPHRTCFGLMKMLASSANECSTPPVLGDNHALIQSLGTMIIPAYESGTESQVDEYYINFLSDLKGTQEFKNFCSNDLSSEDEDANSGSTSDSDESGSTAGSSSGDSGGSSSGSEDGQGLQSADPDDVNTGSATAGSDGGGSLVASTGPETGGETTGGSDTTPPAATSGGSTSGTTGGSTDLLPQDEAASTDEESSSPLSITVSIATEDDVYAQVEAKTNPESLPEGVSIVWFAKGETLPEKDPESADPEVKENDTLTPEAAEPPAQIDLTNVNLGQDNPAAEGEKRYSLSNRMILVEKINGTYQVCAKLIKGEIVVAPESCVEINGDDADDDVPVDEEDEAGKKKKYELVLTPSGSVTITLKVTITPSLESGATLHWIKRNPKPETETKLPGTASSEEEPKETPEEISFEDSKKDEIKDTKDKLDIDVKPEESDKEVCAIVYEDGKQASNLACHTIKKSSEKDEKDNKQPVGPYMPQGPQGPPMMPLRGGGDIMIRGVY